MTKSKIIILSNQYVSTKTSCYFHHQTSDVMTHKFLCTGKKIDKLFFIYAIFILLEKVDIFGLEVVFTVNSSRYDEHEIYSDSSL